LTTSIIQIPILISAVFFTNTRNGLNQSSSELVLSTIVLGLLIIFSIIGSGALSADEYFRSYYKAGYEDEKMEKISL